MACPLWDVGDINHGDIQALKINDNATYAFLGAFLTEMRVVFPPEASAHWHMGGDEMFGQCLEQQPGLEAWMKAHGIVDYGALQQYFTKRLETEVLPQLSPQPPIVVWEENSGLAIADSSLGRGDVGQVYGGDSSGVRPVVEGGRAATFSPSAWYMPGTHRAWT